MTLSVKSWLTKPLKSCYRSEKWSTIILQRTSPKSETAVQTTYKILSKLILKIVLVTLFALGNTMLTGSVVQGCYLMPLHMIAIGQRLLSAADDLHHGQFRSTWALTIFTNITTFTNTQTRNWIETEVKQTDGAILLMTMNFLCNMFVC